MPRKHIAKDRDSAFWIVHVKMTDGNKLTIHCADRWAAHEAAQRANVTPGVLEAYYDSTGYALCHTWESAMEHVKAFSPDPKARG